MTEEVNFVHSDEYQRPNWLLIIMIIGIIIVILAILVTFLLLPKAKKDLHSKFEINNGTSVNQSANIVSVGQDTDQSINANTGTTGIPPTDITKTCNEMNRKLCNSNEVCSGQISTASDSSACCVGSCLQHSDSKTCGSIGGRTCPDTYLFPNQDPENRKYCASEYITASDTEKCCPVMCMGACYDNRKLVNSACVLKTCSEMNASICSSGYLCNGQIVNSSDTNNCCFGSCIPPTEQCTPTCNFGYKCVNNVCVQQTCAEQNYHICPEGTICKFPFNESASDTNRCCVFETSCIAPYDFSISGPMTINNCYDDKLSFSITSTSPRTEHLGYKILVNDVEYFTFSLSSITPGTNTYTLSSSSPPLGTNKVSIVLDPLNEHYLESDKTNNRLDQTFNYAKKDMFVKDITYAAGILTFIIDIDESSPDCPTPQINLFIDGNLFDITSWWGGKAEMNNDVYYQRWNSYTVPGTHSIRVVVDPNNKIDETNEANNELTKSIII